MELRFVIPDLRRFDEVGSEVLACGVFADERPLHGTAGAEGHGGDAVVETVTDGAEVALVPGASDKLDAASDEDSDDDELTAPGSSASGLVAGLPS